MKVYTWEEDFMNNQILREVRLFGLNGEWYEDYENGGLLFTELFTSYREASMWLLEQGYEMEFDHFEFRHYQKQKLVFYKEVGDAMNSVTIEEMEVVK